MSSFEHTVSRSLQCPVCLELLSDPKQLSCTHTFCQKCLSDMLACYPKSKSSSLVCPICRSTTVVKNHDISNLNTNVPVKSLVDDVRNSKQLCEMCDTQSRAVHFCCNCGKNMCIGCLENHNKWSPNLKHEIVSVEDIREGKVVLKKKIYCQEHKSTDGQEHVCTDVCVTCKKFICMRCRMLYHEKKGHIVQDADEYSAAIKTEIESLLVQGKTKAKAIKYHASVIESQRKRVTDRIDARKAEINKTYQALNTKLNDRKADLEKQLEAQRDKLFQKLHELKVSDERFVASVKSASVLSSNSLKAPLDGDIIAIRDSLSGELKNVIGRDLPKIRIATDVGDRAEQLTFTPNSQHDQQDIGELRFETWKLKCEVEHSGRMNAMINTLGDGMGVGLGGGGIEIFSADGKLQRTVLKKFGVGEVGMISDGRYVVLNDHGVKLYIPESEKLDVRFETLDSAGVIKGGLDVDSENQIYIGNRKTKTIQVFTSAGGKAIREIPCEGYEPEQIVCCKDLLLVKHANRVILVDAEGHPKQAVRSETPKVIPWPTLARNHTVLIAWVNHGEKLVCIKEYTNELKYIKTLVSVYKFESGRDWYYLKEFESGEIAFCTPDKLYIFDLSITSVEE